MDITIAGFALVAIISGLVEAIKRGFSIPEKFQPLIAIILGVLFMGIYTLTLEGVLAGVVAGLASSGLYDNAKAIIK